MSHSRREFIQLSAGAAAGLALGPLSFEASAERPNPASVVGDDRYIVARPLALDRVTITGGPLRHAQDLTAAYLLSLNPDRMMAFYRVRAGLAQKAEPYTGWDGGGRNLTGHIAGHHLSAVSLMFATTGDARFKQRADYLVTEMDEVQRKNGDGYLGALENLREAFAAMSKGEIKSGGFDLNGLWSPWYTLHKTYAGLRDAYRYTGNKTALDVERRFAEWANGVLSPMSDEHVQRMLNTEHGGMNEVLADLYADTGDTRWLALSQRFEHRAFTDALKRHQDNLNGKHGNCQIPKLIGSAARHSYTGDAGDLLAASFFFDRVAQHHSYATGGHGLSEYFGPPDQLSPRVDGRTCETCNDYNMLKLARRLFSFRPDASYADFHERALFNHILASIDPADGRTSYMVPVGRGVQQEYQDMQKDFTCCVGSGMESHALHGHGVYNESADTLWVNLFVPSVARFTNGVTITQSTAFPEGETASLAVQVPGRKRFTLAVRRPAWAGDGFVIFVNGERIEQPSLSALNPGAAGGRAVNDGRVELPPSSYVELSREWKSGDTVELTIPKSLRLEPTQDNHTVTAIMWGPLVLAADHGPRVERRGDVANATPVPMLVAAGRPLNQWLTPGAHDGDFTATRVARVPAQAGEPANLRLAPFYRTHRRRYSTYYDLVTPAEFAAHEQAIASERERVRRLEAATVSFAQPGEMQPERDYNYQSMPADRQPARTNGRASRGGPGWFSFDMPVDASGANTLVVTYFNELGLPAVSSDFQILVDDRPLATFEANQGASGFYDAAYPLLVDMTNGKTKVVVKFRASEKGRVLPVFGVRTARITAM